MKVKVSIVLDVDPAVYAASAGIPRAEVREHVKQAVIADYLVGVENAEDEPDGITGWSWS
jgi:hypothetical protein